VKSPITHHVSRFTFSHHSINPIIHQSINPVNDPMNTENTTTPSPEENLDSLLTDIRGGWEQVKSLPATVKSLEDDNTRSRDDLTDLRRSLLSRSTLHAPRSHGCVSDDCSWIFF